MSLSALLCANRGDISTWTAETMDRVLAVENSMFLKAFEERSISLDNILGDKLLLNFGAKFQP